VLISKNNGIVVMNENKTIEEVFSKVPEVTLLFWIIKIAATTLGETAGDALSMSLNLGYIVSTGIFAIIFAIFVAAQIKAKKYNAFFYWATIIATTTLGTTIADYVDRTLGLGYLGGSLILLSLLIISLMCAEKTGGFNLVNYRHSSGVYHEQETEDLHRRI
jgi:uncharacterized membrane-anchored protein